MNTLLYFNASDKPENMGISQLTSNLTEFLNERSSIFVDYVILQDRVEFTKSIINETPVKGYALIFQVPNDFQN